MGWIETLAAFGVASGVARSSVAYAFVSAGHLLGIALVLGPVLLMDLAILRVVTTLDARAVDVLRRTVLTGLALAIPTGVLLASTKPDEYVVNWAFLAKLGVVALALVNAVAYEWRSQHNARARRVHAVLSIGFWLGVLLLGRWIAFV